MNEQDQTTPNDLPQPEQDEQEAQSPGLPAVGQADDLDAAGQIFNNSGKAIEVPSAAEPEDEDMKAIRDNWLMYPAEVESMVRHDMFDGAIGQEVEGVKFDRKVARTAVAELRAMVGDLGVNREEFGYLKDAAVRTASRRGQQYDPIPDREAAVDRINREHGEGAAQAFRAARAYVAKNPRLARFLDRTGLGDDPTTVATIARRALALQRAGKLRIK